MRTDTAARRRAIRSLLSKESVGTQAEIRAVLKKRGFDVTQATVSRDLSAIGAARIEDHGGHVYRLDPDGPDNEALVALYQAVDEFVETIETSGTLIVLTVPPGVANFVASRIDGAPLDGVLGTVAGDDTILVIADEAVGADTVCERIQGTNS